MSAKVLMFGWEFPPHNSGGLGVACLGLTKALAEQGTEVLFVLPKRVDIESEWARFVFADIKTKGTVKYKEIDSLLQAYTTEERYREILKELGIKDHHFGNTLLDEVKRYGLKARCIAEAEEFDVIHAHDWLTFPAAMEAKKASGKPLIVHIHATEFNRTGGQGVHQEIYDIERAGMEAADTVVAVSQFMKDTIVDKYGISAEKVQVVHNGIDPEIYNFKKLPPMLQNLKDQGNKIVLFLGRITVQKGPEYFLEAARKVLDYRDNVYFVMTGSGDMYTYLVEKAAMLGIADKFVFTGFLRGDDNLRVFQCADLFVMPSVSEPFGLVPLEALLNGTPVLISRQSGVSEVLDHALKTDFWDIDEMANKIISVIDHDSLQNHLAAEGTKEVHNVSWVEAAKKCINLYQTLIPA